MLLQRTDDPLSAEKVRARVTRVVAQQLGLDPIAVSVDTKVYQVSADSIETLELAMALEDEFDLEFPDMILDQLLTVGDVTRYLVKRLDP